MKHQHHLPPLETVRQVHIVGVCGTLMGAFAAFLRRQGIQVTGSDHNVYPPMSDVLREAGVHLLQGYSAQNLSSLGVRPDLVVIGNVISADNPEAQAVMQSELPYSSLPEAMEHLFLRETRNLVVAGTHGKTTTASMLAHVLRSAGLDPNFFIGGVAQDLPHSFHLSSLTKGHFFVLEGDEYDTAFWDKVPKFNHYLPSDVILTSVEYDHADIYPDFESVKKAFQGLIARIRSGGRLVACVDDPVVAELCRTKADETMLFTYGSQMEIRAQILPHLIRFEGSKTFFSVQENQKPIAELELQVPGKHNVLNALAVWILTRELGLQADLVQKALANFRGVKRRQEMVGWIGGVRVIDDFAHHPTAVCETIKALKNQYPAQRILVVFEPRSATSRRKVFQKAYEQAFQEAHAAFISTPFDQSRIPEQERFSSDELVKALQFHGKEAFLFQDTEIGVAQVSEYCRPGDVVAVLSNGGFGGFINRLLESLKKK